MPKNNGRCVKCWQTSLRFKKHSLCPHSPFLTCYCKKSFGRCQERINFVVRNELSRICGSDGYDRGLAVVVLFGLRLPGVDGALFISNVDLGSDAVVGAAGVGENQVGAILVRYHDCFDRSTQTFSSTPPLMSSWSPSPTPPFSLRWNEKITPDVDFGMVFAVVMVDDLAGSVLHLQIYTGPCQTRGARARVCFVCLL